MYYFSDYFRTQNYDDDFGDSIVWKQETDKWLRLASQLDRGWYNTGKTRVGNPKQRDEFLGEAKAIYYFHHYLKVKHIKLEPKGKGRTKLDFAYLDENGKQWLVEVKSPSWQGEVMKDESLTQEQKEQRKKQPRVNNSDKGGSYDEKHAVEDSIKNALPKFEEGENNILVITPSMIVNYPNYSTYPSELLENSAMKELKVQDPNNLISRVVILQTRCAGGQEIKYAYRCFSRSLK